MRHEFGHIKERGVKFYVNSLIILEEIICGYVRVLLRAPN